MPSMPKKKMMSDEELRKPLVEHAEKVRRITKEVDQMPIMRPGFSIKKKK